MLYHLRQRSSDEGGFTLIELLVVILIIGILAAIAIPTFLNQTQKANDSSAKSLAQTAETAMETSATDNNGSYTAITNAAALCQVEPSIPCAAAKNQAYLTTATGSATGYTVVVTAAGTSDTFTVIDSAGTITRTCAPGSGSSTGGCASSGASW